MGTFIKTWIDRLAHLVSKEPHLQTARLLRWSVIGWNLFNIALMSPYSQEFYGLGAYTVQRPFAPSQWHDWILEFLRHEAIRPYYYLIQGIQVLALLGALAAFLPRVMILIAFICAENLQAITQGTLDGGDNIMSLLLIYLLFINTTGNPISIKWEPLRELFTGLSNVAFLLARIQIAVVYAASGLYKTQGDLWQSGMAIYYILQGDYSHPLLRELVVAYPMIPMLATYATLLFQLAFPFCVWLRSTRLWILIIGVFFHIGIAFGMGLVEFGIAMCCTYTAFFFESWSVSIGQRVDHALARLPFCSNQATKSDSL